ncbi:MAG: ATP-dependent DNA helicase RecG [Phycisphaerae bacterium]
MAGDRGDEPRSGPAGNAHRPGTPHPRSLSRYAKADAVADIKPDTEVRFVKGVGPKRAEQLAALGIRTVEDLLTYFPRRFDLRRQAQPIGTLRGDEDTATVAGEVVFTDYKSFGRRPYFECTLRDETGWVGVKWFHGGYLRGQIKEGMTIAVSGKVGMYKEALQFVNPQFQTIWDPAGTDLGRDELLPVYPAGANLSSAQIAKVISNVLPGAKHLVAEILPRELLRSRALMPRAKAVAAMHRPEDREQWGRARRRLAYEECLLMQLGIALTRMREVSRPAHPLEVTEQVDRRIRARFPFELTAAQDRAVSEICADLARERPMNRLLQGDVGSGKTVVALYAALLAVARGKQVAIMAPTEILASQHYRNISEYLSGSRVRVALLVGSQGRDQRAETRRRLADGEIDMVVGTHALIEGDVRFRELALVVVDEQHKFGVRQRSGIRGKGYAPHYLVMTATPIPRTLAMTVFGDLDVSVIDELPPGRGKTTTRVAGHGEMDEVLEFVRSQLAAGRQAYFIYPLVNPSENSDLTAARDACEELSAGPLKDFNVALMHGQLPADEKDRVMGDFREGRVQVLVASVVVEVGVDVPSAGVMVVMHAERFGLAQLHQLRGRIGRGRDDAHCILVAGGTTAMAKQRLEVLEKTSDGFKIAEEDLRLRGPGEIFGTRQHGLPELKVADLVEDFELLRLARRDAFAIVKSDPGLNAPHHQRLRSEMLKLYAGKLDLLTGG